MLACFKMLEEKKQEKLQGAEEKQRKESESKREQEQALKQKREVQRMCEQQKLTAKYPPAKRGCGPVPSTSPALKAPSIPDEESPLKRICVFCHGIFREHCQNRLKCGCGRWAHEACVEDTHQDSIGQDIFCPSCTNSICV
jgi:hypothetical protein